MIKRELIDLREKVKEFVYLDKEIHKGKSSFCYYHKVSAILHSLMYEIEQVEKLIPREQLLNELAEVREIHSRANLPRRTQNWPLGYQGDYLTIELLCECINDNPKNSMAYFIDWFALNSPIAQQHRNKVNIQAKSILKTIHKFPSAKILIVGSGSGYDIRSIQSLLTDPDYELFINDLDPAALEYTKKHLLTEVINRSHFIRNNILTYTKELAKLNLKFSLVLFGGVYDYLTDDQIKYVLSGIYRNNLAPTGKIVWTNINENNPYRCWMEYCLNWNLMERNPVKCVELCIDSDIPEKEVSVYFEEARLTNIVEIEKGAVKDLNVSKS